MVEVLLSNANYWFSVAFVIVAILFIVEVASLLFGLSVLGLLDEAPDASADVDNHSFLAIGNWLNLDKVPLLIWLVTFLTLFGLLGLTLNLTTHSLFNFTLPAWSSIIFAATFGLAATARACAAIAKILPKFQTSAVANDDFVGAVAQITLGRASKGNPAEAKFTDNFSQPHYVLVEPFEDSELFDCGEKVILVKKTSHSWLATRYQ